MTYKCYLGSTIHKKEMMVNNFFVELKWKYKNGEEHWKCYVIIVFIHYIKMKVLQYICKINYALWVWMCGDQETTSTKSGVTEMSVVRWNLQLLGML